MEGSEGWIGLLAIVGERDRGGRGRTFAELDFVFVWVVVAGWLGGWLWPGGRERIGGIELEPDLWQVPWVGFVECRYCRG